MVFVCLQIRFFVILKRLFLLLLAVIVLESIKGFELAFSLNILLRQSKQITSLNLKIES